jgi:phage-related protein
MNVYLFIDDRGRSPVREFIDELPPDEKAKALSYIEELKRQGYNLRRPIADYLADGIYELRPKSNRLFYFFFLRDKAIIIHAIKKKTNEVPDRDIELCKKRKRYIQIGCSNFVGDET